MYMTNLVDIVISLMEGKETYSKDEFIDILYNALLLAEEPVAMNGVGDDIPPIDPPPPPPPDEEN